MNTISIFISELSHLTNIDILKKLRPSDQKIVESCLTKIHEASNSPTLSNDLYKIIASNEEGKVPETKATEILKAIHGGREIAQEEFNLLLTEIKATGAKNIKLADLLRSLGFSTTLKNINFSLPCLTVNPQKFGLKELEVPTEPWLATDILRGMDFSDIAFVNCDFSYVDLSQAIFRNVQMTGCECRELILKRAVFEHALLQDCHFSNAMAPESSWCHVAIRDCDLKYMNFYKSHLDEVRFIADEMEGMSFLLADTRASSIKDPVEDNALLIDAKGKFVEDPYPFTETPAPVVALPWSLHTAGVSALRVDQAIKREGGVPLRCNYLPDSIDTKALDNEVLSLIEEIRKRLASVDVKDEPTLAHFVSFPMAMMSLAKQNPGRYPQISALQTLAKGYLSHADALVIPGGADIQPIFYNEEVNGSRPEPDFRRSILEFAILQEVHTRGIPLLAICRGSQLVNIFYGGSLHQDVPGHLFEVQPYKPTPITGAVGQIRHAMGSGAMDPQKHYALKKAEDIATTEAFSVHHQVYKKIGEGLELVSQYGDIPKALENKMGAPQILVQWHPEFKGDNKISTRQKDAKEAELLDPKLSDVNRQFFSLIVSAGKARKVKGSLEALL